MDNSSSSNIDISKLLPPDYSTAAMKKKFSSPMLMKMLLEGINTDMTFNAQGGSTRAYRSVLALSSPVFKAMFRHMREHITSTVDLSHMPIEVLQLLLVFLYSDTTVPELEAAVDKHFTEFYDACFMYEVGGRLVEVLEIALRRNLTPENCWCYYKRRELAQEKRMVYVCMEYMLEYFEEVVASESIKSEVMSNPDLVQELVTVSHYKQVEEIQALRASKDKLLLDVKERDEVILTHAKEKVVVVEGRDELQLAQVGSSLQFGWLRFWLAVGASLANSKKL